MRVNSLDHVNIQSTNLKESVRFYKDVLHLQPKDPPPPLDPKRIQWMHDNAGRAIVHLSSPGSLLGEAVGAIARDTGAVHHIALDCSGHESMVERLTSLGMEFRLNHVVAIDLKQIFVRDPNGVLLELNYRSPG